MLAFAYGCAGLAVVAIVGLLVDHREVGGAPLWAKPLKFAISSAVYGLTWSWLCSLITYRERTVRRASAIVVAMLTVELVIIVGQAARGTFSHFNFMTVPDSIMYEIMAVSIAIVWCGNLVLTVMVLRSDIEGRARKLALGLGGVIAVVGIAMGALITLPHGNQLNEMLAGHATMVGGHTVGAPEGGPGLPLLGWSTIGGDLRIPHFIGMHALQVLLLWHVIVARSSRLAHVRPQMMWIGAAGFSGLLALVTWQAYRGQPLVSPDVWTLTALGVLVAGLATAGAVVLTRARPLATVTWLEEPARTTTSV